VFWQKRAKTRSLNLCFRVCFLLKRLDLSAALTKFQKKLETRLLYDSLCVSSKQKTNKLKGAT
jgi:hypothetical protein